MKISTSSFEILGNSSYFELLLSIDNRKKSHPCINMKLHKNIAAAVLAFLLGSIVTLCAAPEIAANTTLNIKLFGVLPQEQAKFDGNYQVDPRGFIYLSLLKDGIKASGISSSQLAREIEVAYKNAEIYSDPRINVISNKDQEAQKIDAQIITVGGKVRNPGPVQYIRGMTLFKAVAAAGGADAFGADNRVELHQRGVKKIYDIKNNAQHMAIPVFPGATIRVPQKNVWGK